MVETNFESMVFESPENNFWMPLGVLLESSWGAFGRSWSALGALLGRLGRLLGASWTSWTQLGRLLDATWKNPRVWDHLVGHLLARSWTTFSHFSHFFRIFGAS